MIPIVFGERGYNLRTNRIAPMALAPGTRLGPYEILGPAGAGGMGEVYRARDSRLDRDVAIKILPEHLSATPGLRERFEREARAISQLSHPNICVLYDVGKQEGADYLVLEYLEGETLGARLRKGPLPTEQVLKYGAQIADALDKAHRHGVVHRDLKPDNVMLLKSGVKLLDFGLAKPLATPVGMSSSIAATMTHSPLTTEGTLVGTFQYMAPEQLEGREADARSDIFALGCVLYEMSSGKRAFDGKSTASVVASIMNSEPAPLTTVAPMTPPALEWATRKCMAKDPEDRWQSAVDLASELRWIQEGGSRAGVPVPTSVRGRRKLLRWAVLAAVAIAGIGVGFLARRPPAAAVMRVGLNLPRGTQIAASHAAVLSPDGRRVAMMLADPQGKPRIWVRTLASDAVQPMDGTEGAIDPFWSPDSQFVAFFSEDGKLKKISAAGGQPETICEVWTVFGGSWSPTGMIVYSAGPRGIFRVPAAGGTPVEIHLQTKGFSAYRKPTFLPDGHHILVTANFAPLGVFAISADTGEVQPVLQEENSSVIYAEPGYLIYLHGDTLMAQPFDAKTRRTSGNPRRLTEAVSNSSETFSTSATGLLLYQKSFQTQLTWVDPAGNRVATLGDAGYISAPYLSPDDRYVLATVRDAAQARSKLWLYDVARGTSSPFTLGEGEDQYPAWSPDSKQVAYTSSRKGKEQIYLKPMGGGSQEQLLLSMEGGAESDRWSSDGRYLLFDYFGSQSGGGDVWALPLFGERKPFPVVQSSSNDVWGTLSLDGKWVAYESDESGRGEIYVVPFPGPGGKWQVSTGGGVVPIWRSDKELFYTTPDSRVFATEFEAKGTDFAVGKSRELFSGRALGNITGLDVTRDNKRWLVAVPVEESNSSPLILITNWTQTLRH
jgi:Tol biopolymer transport system component